MRFASQISNSILYLLWQIARRDLADDRIALYEDLLAKNQDGDLKADEQSALNVLREEADLLMLRRSYAYALLKWRGHRIPTLSELQTP